MQPAAFRLAHGVSTNVLVFESPDNIICLAQFDAFLLPAHAWMSSLAYRPQFGFHPCSNSEQAKQTHNDNHQPPNLLAHKQQKSCSTLLVIPHSDLPHCLHSQTIVHFIQKFGFVCSKEAKALAA